MKLTDFQYRHITREISFSETTDYACYCVMVFGERLTDVANRNDMSRQLLRNAIAKVERRAEMLGYEEVEATIFNGDWKTITTRSERERDEVKANQQLNFAYQQHKRLSK